MNQFYALPRRATEPVTLQQAPTASMLDPNLDNHRIPHTHAQTQLLPAPNFAALQLQHNAAAIHAQNNGYPSPIHNRGHSNGSGSGSGHANGGDTSAKRNLPSTDINESTIESAYVHFIMYCNPSIPLDKDTTELRKVFRNPPRSDGKSFSPFTLYDLISRLEMNDIKTWTQLVIELGVEKPDVAKNQSTQKVQQYAVRLKVNNRPFQSHKTIPCSKFEVCRC